MLALLLAAAAAGLAHHDADLSLAELRQQETVRVAARALSLRHDVDEAVRDLRALAAALPQRRVAGAAPAQWPQLWQQLQAAPAGQHEDADGLWTWQRLGFDRIDGVVVHAREAWTVLDHQPAANLQALR